MEIINSVFSWIIKQRIHQMELFIKYPVDVQNDLLQKLVYQAKDTEWGKKHEYKSINSYDDYKSRVPLQDYETLKTIFLELEMANKIFCGIPKLNGLQNHRER